jgi:hypothetical protein
MRLLFFLIALAAPGLAAAEPVERFALTIGHNDSSRADTQDLRYADDDAIAMHRLLGDAGVKSSLLVAPDRETRELDAGLRPHGRPRWKDLEARFAEIERQIRDANRRGRATSLLIFYSGHGDVAHGEGYVELEDRHLTRSLLRDRILDRTQASEVHLVIDACRSYYLAFEKGPGGSRRPAGGALVAGRRGRIGYILSTSSDRESHEWEVFQGGIFSHEVRSGLRGAADVDRDGAITYAELGAFLTVANRGIKNHRYRPDFVVRPPRALADRVLAWKSEASALLIDTASDGRMYVEGPGGERLLDVHPHGGELVTVRLPSERPVFVRRQDGTVEYVIEDSGPVQLSELTASRVRVASKGAIHLAFRALFSVPFGATDVEEYERLTASVRMETDVEVSVGAAAPPGGRGRFIAGTTALVAGAFGLGLGGWAIERSIAARNAESQQARASINDTMGSARLGAGISLGVAAGAGLFWWLLRDDEPDAMTVTPTAGDGVGLSIGGRF